MTKTRTFNLLTGVLAVAVLLAVPAVALAAIARSAAAPLPTGNLIQNPGAEAGAAAKDLGAVPVPGWQTANELTAVAYQPKTIDMPSTDDAARLRGGSNYFVGGRGRGETASASQTIDVAASARIVDAGTVRATLSALIGGSRAQEDRGVVEAAFLGEGGAQLGKVSVGPITAEQRKRVTKLLPQTKSAPVPVGTRSVRVTMTATRIHGSYNEALFDNLSLTLADQPAPHAALAVTRVCGASPAVVAAVKPTGGVRIASVLFSVKGSVKSLKTAAPFRGKLPLTRTIARNTVTAVVTDTAGRVTTLTKPVKRCA
jgi:hypothetical protein